jgi:hypothetical protein
MESISVSLDTRSFQVLLNGLIQKNYYQSSISYDSLAKKVYTTSELTSDEIRNEILLLESVGIFFLTLEPTSMTTVHSLVDFKQGWSRQLERGNSFGIS